MSIDFIPLCSNHLFNVSHAQLEIQWDVNADYALIPIDDGLCDCCCLSQRVITQQGAYRFGVRAGFCLTCLPFLFETSPSCHIETGFKESEERHIIQISCDNLQVLFERTITPSLREDEKQAILKIIKNPAVQELLRKSKKPYQCEECLGMRDIDLQSVNAMRGEGKMQVVACLCCAAFNRISGNACSMISCPKCSLSNSKICVYCVNGGIVKNADGSAYIHNLEKCSKARRFAKDNQLPLPEIRKCECEKTDAASA